MSRCLDKIPNLHFESDPFFFQPFNLQQHKQQISYRAEYNTYVYMRTIMPQYDTRNKMSKLNLSANEAQKHVGDKIQLC